MRFLYNYWMTLKINTADEKTLKDLLERNIFIDDKLRDGIYHADKDTQADILQELKKMDKRQTKIFRMLVEKMGIENAGKFFEKLF